MNIKKIISRTSSDYKEEIEYKTEAAICPECGERETVFLLDVRPKFYSYRCPTCGCMWSVLKYEEAKKKNERHNRKAE